jgi:hypothetical protein
VPSTEKEGEEGKGRGSVLGEEGCEGMGLLCDSAGVSEVS